MPKTQHPIDIQRCGRCSPPHKYSDSPSNRFYIYIDTHVCLFCSRKLPPECAQEFIFPEPAVRVNAAASSDSDATPIGAGTPATRSPTNSLGARLKQQDVAAAAAASAAAAATVAANAVFVEPKPVKGAVSLGRSLNPLRVFRCVAFDF